MESSYSFTVTAGLAAYPLAPPKPICEVFRVEYRPTTSTRVIPLEGRQFNSMDELWGTWPNIGRSNPNYYTIWGTSPNLILYPTPNDAGSVSIYYYAYPVPLATDGSAASSTLDIPEGWADLAIMYAEYRAQRRDRDPRWQEIKTEYETQCTDLMGIANRSHMDVPGRITADIRQSMGSWWGSDPYGFGQF